MTDPIMVLASGVVMMLWRPCRSREARAPRLAIAMLLLTAASIWAATFSLAVGVAAGELGDPLRACGVLWRQLLAGHLSWVRLLPLAAWTMLFVGRGVAALVQMRSGSTALRRVAIRGTPATIGGCDVTIVSGLGTPAATLGVIHTSIVMDEAFCAGASDRARGVVVEHEMAHVRGHHGLVDAVARALTAPLSPLRAASDLYNCVRRHLEALADDAAVRRHDARTVGETLSTIALAHAPARGLGVAGDCVWRVRRLLAPAGGRTWRDVAVLVPLVAMMAIGVTGATANAAMALGPVSEADVCVI